ncbi:MAG TPA: hypothetical protein VMG58_15865 [Candidatus Sulfotelmatobacter sp.]|nr:hypothetical protein [Candidatus Sulfotelmatobacter sp.]
MSRPRRTLRALESVTARPPGLTLGEALVLAVSWQPEAEQVIALCILPGGKDANLARRTGRVAWAYHQLREAVRRLEPSAARHEADQLLNYHEQLVDQALLLGYRPDSAERERVAGHFRGGLGGPAERLRRLCEDVNGSVMPAPRRINP